MRRRTFLTTSAVAGAAITARAAATSQPKPGDIPRRVFGKTGEKLTIIGQAGGRFPMITFEEAKAVTQRAYDLGINYFDCARIYWNGKSEEVYGAVLPPFRKNIFLTSKSPERSRKGAEADLEKSLRALKTDYLDLWQMHQVSEMAEVEQIFAPGGAIEAFEAAKKAGKCRFIGFTGHHDPEVHLAMLKHYDKYDTILMPLNAADPSYLSFEKMVLPIAVQRGMGNPGDEEHRQRRSAVRPAPEGMPELRTQSAGPLCCGGLHHRRSNRGRREGRAAIPTDGGGRDGDPAPARVEARRSATGELEAEQRARVSAEICDGILA